MSSIVQYGNFSREKRGERGAVAEDILDGNVPAPRHREGPGRARRDGIVAYRGRRHTGRRAATTGACSRRVGATSLPAGPMGAALVGVAVTVGVLVGRLVFVGVLVG